MKQPLGTRKNKIILLSMAAGALIAYIYWLHFAIYWGTYPLSGEWWVNCVYGSLSGGLLGALSHKK